MQKYNFKLSVITFNEGLTQANQNIHLKIWSWISKTGRLLDRLQTGAQADNCRFIWNILYQMPVWSSSHCIVKKNQLLLLNIYVCLCV